MKIQGGKKSSMCNSEAWCLTLSIMSSKLTAASDHALSVVGSLDEANSLFSFARSTKPEQGHGSEPERKTKTGA